MVDATASKRPLTRVSLACLPCRSHRVKCDGQRPRCGRCENAGNGCDYAESRRGGRKRKRIEAGVVSSIPETLCGDVPWEGDGLGLAGLDADSATVGTDGVSHDAVGSDELVGLYYVRFHNLHPFVPPRKHLVGLCRDASKWPRWRPLVAALRLIGHLYGSHQWSSALEKEIMDYLSHVSRPDPVLIQCRLLYSMALFWQGNATKARSEMDLVTQASLEIGLSQREFAAAQGSGDPVLQESWRRTWWMVYITDGYYAGTLGTSELSVADVEATVDLPCHESEYESGNIPSSPHTMDDFDSREFAPEATSFSSFAYLIGAVRCASLALAHTPQDGNNDTSTQVIRAVDASTDGWLLLLPKDKRQVMNSAGDVDELMFQAHLIIHVTTIGLHRPLSDLRYNDVEHVSSCAREPARGHPRPDLINVHTVRVLRAVEAQIRLLALPARPFHHTPFTTCMVSEGTLALLSACRYLLGGRELAVARDQIRMTIGCLQALGEVWRRTASNVREIQTIARHVLGLGSKSTTSHTPDGAQVPSLTCGSGQESLRSSVGESSSNQQSSEGAALELQSQWFSLDDLHPDFAWWPGGDENDGMTTLTQGNG